MTDMAVLVTLMMLKFVSAVELLGLSGEKGNSGSKRQTNLKTASDGQ